MRCNPGHQQLVKSLSSLYSNTWWGCSNDHCVPQLRPQAERPVPCAIPAIVAAGALVLLGELVPPSIP